MDSSDITYIAYIVICALLAAGTSGGGGGKRMRIPSTSS